MTSQEIYSKILLQRGFNLKKSFKHENSGKNVNYDIYHRFVCVLMLISLFSVKSFGRYFSCDVISVFERHPRQIVRNYDIHQKKINERKSRNCRLSRQP